MRHLREPSDSFLAGVHGFFVELVKLVRRVHNSPQVPKNRAAYTPIPAPSPIQTYHDALSLIANAIIPIARAIVIGSAMRIPRMTECTIVRWAAS